jgi:uncharacterized protein (DUF2267 family)
MEAPWHPDALECAARAPLSGVRFMSTSHIKAFDKTFQITHLWLGDIQREFRWEDRHKAYLALRAVLHTLRDCLFVEEAVSLGAQLPMLLRGMYYDGWMPAKVPVRMDRDEFLESVRQHFKDEPRLDAEPVVEGVLRVMARNISRGELRDVKHVLSAGLQQLWPSSVS